MLKFKLYLFKNKYIGVFTATLFDCPICLGFHIGYIVGLLALLLECSIALTVFSLISYMLLWGFVGSFACMLTSLVLDLLLKERE